MIKKATKNIVKRLAGVKKAPGRPTNNEKKIKDYIKSKKSKS